MEETTVYPVHLSVDYPQRDLNRLSTGFRIFAAIPILIVLVLISGASYRIPGAGGLIFLALMLMLVFRQKYPRWWFDWNLALTRFGTRVSAYLLLLRDEYPSTDEEQAVHLDIPYPDAKQGLNRWLPLVKWFLAILHYVVLVFLWIAAIVCAIIAWFAILFTGRYPRGLFDFEVGVVRWYLRVAAYAFLLTTDRYPHFRLSE